MLEDELLRSLEKKIGDRRRRSLKSRKKEKGKRKKEKGKRKKEIYFVSAK
ncbi:MAG: hypothetical protein KAJ14_14290 [Candidatus Omnitrophica bacterium]|nr:hypothetical protein [Candidatus Omnitrophota bacterium]